jgi:hypothetical protein
MALYHLHSDVLGGFYQSEILVEASSREEAVERVVNGYRGWVQRTASEYYGVVPGFFHCQGDSEFDGELERNIDALRREAAEKLERVEGGVLVLHSN